jgi:hypothetical protein
MCKNLSKVVVTIVWVLLASLVQAGKVEIEWQNPDKYRDIEAGNEPQKNFKERVTASLTSAFADAAEDHLPAEQVLHLTITDVDLAGGVEYFFVAFPQGIRMMRDIYFPSIRFSWELKDASGTVIKSGSENIKDMGYRFSMRMFINDPPFNYENRLIHDWISKTFD